MSTKTNNLISVYNKDKGFEIDTDIIKSMIYKKLNKFN